MTDSELRAVIARLRRSTRNAAVLDVCDALEARLATAALVNPVAATPAEDVAATDCMVCEAKRARQRTKMQRYREKAK